MGYTGRLHLKGEPFSGFRYSEREGISLVEVYKRLGNSNPLFHSVRGLERACKGKKLIEMFFLQQGRGVLIRGVRDFVGLLIYASFFTGFRKHPVPRGGGAGGSFSLIWPIRGCAAGRGIFFVFPVLTGYIIPRETVVNRVYNSARDW